LDAWFFSPLSGCTPFRHVVACSPGLKSNRRPKLWAGMPVLCHTPPPAETTRSTPLVPLPGKRGPGVFFLLPPPWMCGFPIFAARAKCVSFGCRQYFAGRAPWIFYSCCLLPFPEMPPPRLTGCSSETHVGGVHVSLDTVTGLAVPASFLWKQRRFPGLTWRSRRLSPLTLCFFCERADFRSLATSPLKLARLFLSVGGTEVSFYHRTVTPTLARSETKAPREIAPSQYPKGTTFSVQGDWRFFFFFFHEKSFFVSGDAPPPAIPFGFLFPLESPPP